MDSMEHRLDGRQPRGDERQTRIVNPKNTLPYFLPNTLQYGRQEDFRHHSLHMDEYTPSVKFHLMQGGSRPLHQIGLTEKGAWD